MAIDTLAQVAGSYLAAEACNAIMLDQGRLTPSAYSQAARPIYHVKCICCGSTYLAGIVLKLNACMIMMML